MAIHSSITNRAGETLPINYCDAEGEDELKGRRVSGVHAYCFCGDKLVLVYSDKKGYWTPPGGGVETGEGIQEAVVREVREETNMRVLKQRLIGYQEIIWPDRVETQARSVCLVEPLGEFVSDPDGDVTRIELVDPKDVKKYFDWGEIGDRLLERALEVRPDLESN